ncbi:hypothetical protein RJT34_13197 [Clitoria ternatea]|uniref:Uncharacterized protein n=1 Tax=Clitoria ternatea TaxID=43366 RepID=A0AAN9JQG5_CLITE
MGADAGCVVIRLQLHVFSSFPFIFPWWLFGGEKYSSFSLESIRLSASLPPPSSSLPLMHGVGPSGICWESTYCCEEQHGGVQQHGAMCGGWVQVPSCSLVLPFRLLLLLPSYDGLSLGAFSCVNASVVDDGPLFLRLCC